MQIIKNSFIKFTTVMVSVVTLIINKVSNITTSYNGKSTITTQVILISTIDLELI